MIEAIEEIRFVDGSRSAAIVLLNNDVDVWSTDHRRGLFCDDQIDSVDYLFADGRTYHIEAPCRTNFFQPFPAKRHSNGRFSAIR